MELHRLRYFLAAADELSFRRGADVLSDDQSAVSRQIAAPYNELDVTLFERKNTGARLIEIGRMFLADVRGIVTDVGRARETIAAVVFGTEGRCRLEICEDVTTPTFATMIAAHRESCPTVALDLFEIPSAMQSAALRRGEIDAGLLLPPVKLDGIQLENLWSEDWLMAMPSGHRLADMEVVPIGGLGSESFITAHPEFDSGYRARSQEMFVAAGVRPCIVTHAFRRLTIAMLVQSGAGVTLVQGTFSSAVIDGIVTHPLLSNEHRMRVAAAYPNGDMQGIVAQFLRVASAAVATIQVQ
ncbi:MAG: LysR substrate-binding domain-containing protein [Parvularcula sp.]|jgi:DNA-binding transcriptional LysR family regulator|nr:LysR substrate-binding domain-containing protein [Parvularcula sp.]